MKDFIFQNGSDKNMCMKIKELNGLSANELLEKAGQADVVPVDIARLCRDLQIITKPCDFSPIEYSNEYKEQVAQKGSRQILRHYILIFYTMVQKQIKNIMKTQLKQLK